MSEKSCPIKDVRVEESSGQTLGDSKGFRAVIKLVANQTRPLFVPPNLVNMLLICYIIFTIFGVGHGTYLW